MTTILALLRGVNVSGHNMIKMTALKSALENVGFQNIRTYLNTGNIFVDTNEESVSKISFVIKQELFRSFSMEIPVIIIRKKDMEDCFENNPFLKENGCDVKSLYVAFVSKTLEEKNIHDLKLSLVKPDEAIICPNYIYLKYHAGAGKTKLDNKYIEKKLQLTSTIRNWNTVTQLLKLYQE